MDGFGLHITLARSDSEHARFLTSINNPDAGVVSMRVRPEMRRFGWLSRDLLSALGKRRDVSGKGRNDAADTALLPAWLLAHDITDVIICGAELCSDRILAELVTVAASCRLRLWLVADNSSSEPLASLAKDWPTVPIDEDTFNETWEPTLERELRAVGSDLSDWVPDSDFVVFLEDVAEFCPPEHALKVEASYRQAAAQFQTLLEGEPVLGEERVTELVREVLNGCVTLPSATVRLRAFQEAAFGLGWYVQLDLPQLFATGVVDRSAVAADAGTWVRLRAYRQPHRGAVCAMHLSDIHAASQLTLTVGDVAASGTEVTLDGTVHRMPAGSEVFLRAARLHRLLAGADDRDPLFVSDDGSPLGLRMLTRAISDAGLELGLLLAGSQIDRKRPTAKQWRQRCGVSVQHLVPSGDR